MTANKKPEEKERKESVKTLLNHLRVHDEGVILRGAISDSPSAKQARKDQENYAQNYYFDARAAEGEKRSEVERRFEKVLNKDERSALLDQYHEKRTRTAYANAALLVSEKGDEIFDDAEIKENLIRTADEKGLHELVNANASVPENKEQADKDLAVLSKYATYKKAHDYLDSLDKYDKAKKEEETKLTNEGKTGEDAKVVRKSGLEVILNAPKELDDGALRNATVRAAVQRASKDEYDAKTREVDIETVKLTAQIDPSFEDARAGIKELCKTIEKDMQVLTGTDKDFEAGISERIAANLKLAITSGKGPLVERALNTIYLASNKGEYGIGTRFYDALHKEYNTNKSNKIL